MGGTPPSPRGKSDCSCMLLANKTISEPYVPPPENSPISYDALTTRWIAAACLSLSRTTERALSLHGKYSPNYQ